MKLEFAVLRTNTPRIPTDQGAKQTSSAETSSRPQGLLKFRDTLEPALQKNSAPSSPIEPAITKGEAPGPVQTIIRVGTPPPAGQLAEAGLGNILIPEWQEQIAEAMFRAEASGDIDKGFLAWTDQGFIVHYNSGLNKEQNKRLAEISLTFGIAIDRLPGADQDAASPDRGITEQVDRFIAEFDRQAADFLNDPSKGIRLSHRRRRIVLEVDRDSGLPVSYNFRRRRGFSRFVRRALGVVSTALDPGKLVSSALKRIPGAEGIGRLIESAIPTINSEIRRTIDAISNSPITFRNLLRTGKDAAKRALPFIPGGNYIAAGIEALEEIFPTLQTAPPPSSRR